MTVKQDRHDLLISWTTHKGSQKLLHSGGALEMRQRKRGALTNPFERIESLCPLRFRVSLGDDSHILEVLR